MCLAHVLNTVYMLPLTTAATQSNRRLPLHNQPPLLIDLFNWRNALYWRNVPSILRHRPSGTTYERILDFPRNSVSLFLWWLINDVATTDASATSGFHGAIQIVLLYQYCTHMNLQQMR